MNFRFSFLKTSLQKRKDQELLFRGVILNTTDSRDIKSLVFLNTRSGFWTPSTTYEFSVSAIVYLENPEFEDEFNCFSKDDIHARTIFTLPFMEKKVKFRKKYPKKSIYVSFVLENKIYCGVQYKSDPLDIHLFRKFDFQKVESMYEELIFLRDLSNTLSKSN